MKRLHLLAACLAAAVTTPAAAVTIDFSTYDLGSTFDTLVVGSATFVSSSGILSIADLGGGKALCAFDGVGCTGSLSVFFADGASRLSTTYSGDDVAGSAVLFQGESDILAFGGLSFADGDPSTTTRIGPFRFEGVRLLALTSSDPGGVAFNDFSFVPLSAVPEPATWALMIAGFAATGAALRRRRRPVAAMD